MPDPGIAGSYKPRPVTIKPTVNTKTATNTTTYPGVNPGVPDLFSNLIGSVEATETADKSAALKDIALDRRKLAWQKQTGLRDIAQDRTAGLKAAINNALSRGIYNSGVRVGNEQLVNRESNEAAGDLKQQISFALEALNNRAANINGRGSAGGGLTMNDVLGIWGQISQQGSTYGWSIPQPWGNPQLRGAPGFAQPAGSNPNQNRNIF